VLQALQLLAGIAITVFAFSYTHAQTPKERTPFTIPLVKLSTLDETEPSEFKKVRVAIDEDKEYALITRADDVLIKNTRNGREKITYAETPGQFYVCSEFEKEHIGRVVESLIATLTIFENDLEKQRFGKCLYLDSFFPRFLKGFYYLSCAIVGSAKALPEKTNIPDELFDVSLNSRKSEERIENWLAKKDYVIKVRIAARELIFQLKEWQKQDLSNYKQYPQLEFDEQLKETYSLFIALYFNQKS